METTTLARTSAVASGGAIVPAMMESESVIAHASSLAGGLKFSFGA